MTFLIFKTLAITLIAVVISSPIITRGDFDRAMNISFIAIFVAVILFGINESFLSGYLQL